MEAKKIYDYLLAIEQDMQQSITQIEAMKADVMMLIEHNATLEVENQNLRDHLNKLQKGPSTSSEPELSKSRTILEKLYEDGFHVCNDDFGKHRDNGEPCVFCLDVIYGERR